MTTYLGRHPLTTWPAGVAGRWLGRWPMAGLDAAAHSAANAAALLQASLDFRYAADTTGGDAKNVQGVLTMVGWHEPPLAPGETLFDHYAAMFTGESLTNSGPLPNGLSSGIDPNEGSAEMLVQLEAALALIRAEQEARGTAIPEALRGTAVAAAPTDMTSIHSFTSIAGRDADLDPHPWTGQPAPHKLAFDPAGDMPFGGDGSVTLADTINKKLSRVVGRLLASQSQLSADGVALNDPLADDNCRTWLSKYAALLDVALDWEFASNVYEEHYPRKYMMLDIWLPAGDPLRATARELLDRWYETRAAVHTGGWLDAATMRAKSNGRANQLTATLGYWSPIEGASAADIAAQTWLRNHLGQLPWSDYTPPAAVTDTFHHQGVTTLEGRLPFALPDTDAAPYLDTVLVNEYRAARWQHFSPDPSARAAFCLSSIAHGQVGGNEPNSPNSRGRIARGDPPRRSKLTVLSGSTYRRLWLAHPIPFNSFHGSTDHYSSRAEWLQQHRNAILWTVDAGLWTHKDTGVPDSATTEFSGPCPVPDEASAGNGWYCARYGHVFVAWWFAGAHDFAGDEIVYGNQDFPHPGASVRRIRTTLAGNRMAAILAAWPASTWADFATFAATLQPITPAWDATAKVLTATLPLLRPAEPTATDAVPLSLTWGQRLEVDGVLQAAPGDPVVTRW